VVDIDIGNGFHMKRARIRTTLLKKIICSCRRARAPGRSHGNDSDRRHPMPSSHWSV